MKYQEEKINKALHLHFGDQKRKNSIKWIGFNSCLLSILIFDVYKTNFYYDFDFFFYAESFAIVYFLFALLKNLITYIYYAFFIEEIACETEDQRILLNLKNNNSFVRKKTENQNEVQKQKNLMENDFLNVSNIKNLSWQSFGDPSSANLSQQSSWLGSNNKNNSSLGSLDSTYQLHKTDINSSFQSPSRLKKSEFISTTKKMEEFLTDISEQEKKISSAIEAHNNSANNYNSFWGIGFDVNGFVSSLKNLTYQLSPHHKQSLRDENFSNKDEENSEIIRQMSANKLSNYVANVKMWIHKTILESLVNAMDETDKAFEQRGFTDMKLGFVGIERLKKIATSNQHLVVHIPTLSKLIPFLELTTNQEFLVQRIRELAKGSCLNNYKFTSSSYDHLSTQMSDHIPNDAGILFHLFCTYLDSQLSPVPDIIRPFYNRYVFIGDSKKSCAENIIKEMTKNKAKCAILCSNPITPKFNFVTDKIHGSSYDRNNLFYVIIQFLFHLKADGSVLETVSLGRSGLNLINVIEEE